MNDFLRNDPIVTISTSTKDKCAIGIIRISGFKDVDIFTSLIGINKKKIKPRYSHYIKIKDEDLVLDDGLLLYFPSPNSYTGENLIELHLHGNPISLNRIERHIIDKYKIMRALPGEFTYRAYRNKKLTLAQVEGLDLILNANTAIGLDSGLSTLNGKLYQSYLNLRDAFYKLCSSIELNIDFSEDVGEENAINLMKDSFLDFDKKIKQLYRQSRGSLNQMLKPEIAFFGETNAGKSTLFNKLVGDNRAIVSDIAGTTRDFISEYIYINESAFRLIDTAGFRETDDAIESEGIERTKSLRSSSFASIYVLNPFLKVANKLASEIASYDYIVLTHSDRENFLDSVKSLNLLNKVDTIFVSGKSGPIEPLVSYDIGSIGPNSNSGPIEPLLDSINIKYLESFSENTVNIERHQIVIEGIYKSWSTLDICSDFNDLGVVSHKIEMIKPKVEELIGIVAPEDVLNNIFTNFCIGK